MLEVITGDALPEALKENTYQMPYQETIQCVKCGLTAKPILLVDDEDGELHNNSPERMNGKPIWPHDSCSFVLYMCEDCGEVTTDWNQA